MMTKLFKPVSGALIVYGLAVFLSLFMGGTSFFTDSFFPAFAPVFVYILAAVSIAAGLGGLFVKDPKILKILAWAVLLVGYLVFFMSYSAPVGTIVVDFAVLLCAIIYFKGVQKRSEVQRDRS